MTVFFVTHPEVLIDPAVPVPKWGLSPRGIERMRLFAAAPELAGLASVWASGEVKAIEAAGLLAAPFGLGIDVEPDLHENDRAATGYLPAAEFETVADAFFAQPEASVRGWERAVDAQDRIAAAVERVLARSPPGDVAIVAHGAVGTLLLCRYLGEAIDRRRDQPFTGHVFAFERESRAVLHPWRPIAPR